MFCVQQTIEEKIEAKKKEKFSTSSELIQHAQSREFLHLPVTIEEQPRSDRKVSMSSTDSAAFKSVSAGSCDSEDFVIHRRPSMKSTRSLRLDLARPDDRISSSSYEPAEYLRVSDRT